MSIIVCCDTPFAPLVLKGESTACNKHKTKVSGTFRRPRSGGYGTAHRIVVPKSDVALLEQGMNVPIRGTKEPSPFRAESMSYQINPIRSFLITVSIARHGDLALHIALIWYHTKLT